MNLSVIAVIAIAAFAISAWLTRRFCDPTSVVYVLDHPNERSLHEKPVSRGGGLAILIAVIGCISVLGIFFPLHGLAGIALGTILVAIVSFVDDRFTVPPHYRFFFHVIAAAAILYGGLALDRLVVFGAVFDMDNAIGIGLSLLFVVWMINLYNFMDGMDGFAGGMALFGFGTFSIMGLVAGHGLFMSINLLVAMAAAGFLVFNFPPARIFMGDIGSSSLGLLAAATTLWGVKEHVVSVWAAILVFSPFIADATVTLLRRLLRRERIWQAHKTHYYQRLVQAGWGHRKTVLVEYVIMFGCGITALLSLRATATIQAIMLVSWVLFYIIFFYWVSWYVSRQRRGSA